VIEPHDEKYGVDVCRDDLLCCHFAGDFARELTAPRQDGLDGARCAGHAGPHRHPIADSGEILSSNGAMENATGLLRIDFAIRREQAIDVIELDPDARGNETIGGVRRKHLRPALIPAVVCKIESHFS
jgi:hypothetical protein